MPAQSRLTHCDPMDCSPPGSSVHGILQARTLEWVAMPSARDTHIHTLPLTWVSVTKAPNLKTAIFLGLFYHRLAS